MAWAPKKLAHQNIWLRPNKKVKTDYRGVPCNDPNPRRGSRLPSALCVNRISAFVVATNIGVIKFVD